LLVRRGDFFLLLQDMINERIIFLNPGDSLEKAVRIFRHDKIDTIPVVDPESKLLSAFTRTNLYDALLNGASLKDSIDPHVVSRVVSLRADLPYETVADLVKNSPVGNAPVIDAEGKVVGVFTKTDMVLTLLRKSELLNAQLKAILDSMYNGVIAVDRGGLVTLVNSGAERLLNIKKEMCLGLPLGAALPELDMAPALERGETKAGLKYRCGEIITVTNITPLIDGDTVVGAIAIFQDLTDLELVARELETVKALNQTLDTVLNIIYDGIILVDDNGCITLANRVFTEFMDMLPEDIVGKHITAILDGSRLHIVAKTGVPETGEIQKIRGKPLIVSRLPIIKDGRAVGAVGKIVFPQLAEIQELAEKLGFLQNKVAYYQEELQKTKTARTVLDGIVAESPAMKNIKQEIMQVAGSTSTIMITGESGTGKEVVAQAIHMCSDRSDGPFIKVNCAAIPENLLEAEIFGYAPGAFTGAVKNGKPGRFELADGGTIFLDEIGDMSLALQAKILRVLQEREFERVGATRSIRVNVRILAATNKDLKKAIADGIFREDLFYRLNVISLHLPSLRERSGDIEPLARNFIEKYNLILKAGIKGISASAMAVLLRHGWPGNVRELENVIERAVNYARSDFIQVAHLPPYLANAFAQLKNGSGGEISSYRSKLNETEREMIVSALEKAGGNKTRAAKILNLSRSRLYVKLKKFGLLG